MPFRFLLCASLLLFAGCRAPDAPKPTASPAKFISPNDDLGREVALSKPAARVIIIGPGAVETMWALGAGTLLVGRDDYAHFPTQTKKVAIAGNFQGPNVEQCVALRPDLVIVQGETWDKARVEQWQTQIGAPVAALVPKSLATLRADIQKLATWTGKPNRAAALNAKLRAASSTLRAKAFIEIGRSPLYTAGSGTLVDEVIRAGGFQNAAPVRGYQAFGTESLLAAQPDVYVVPSGGTRADALKQLRAHPALSKLKCVQAGRVVVVNGDLLLTAGPRLVQGIEILRRESTKLENLKIQSK